MTRSIFVATLLAASVTSLSAWAQKPSVQPANGQSAQQQGSDDAQCLSSAQQQTGIDPAAIAAAPAPATGPQGERVRGAARGGWRASGEAEQRPGAERASVERPGDRHLLQRLRCLHAGARLHGPVNIPARSHR